jgi:Cof subfamily protein (haloacid dehalogenase superfamily)
VIQMLALDVDGTLAVRGDEVSPATRAALHRAAEAGVEVVIATGRRFRTAHRVVEAVGLSTPVVCLGGALIKDGDLTTLNAQGFAAADYAAVGEVLAKHGLTLIGQRDSHALGGCDFVVDASIDWNPQIEHYMAGNGDFSEKVTSPLESPRTDVLVVGTFGPEADLTATLALLNAQYPNRFETVIVPAGWSGAFYLEIIPAAVSKWAALLTLAEARDIESQSICAVGDQRNDLPMVKGAGVGVAMGNAHPDLKAAANWVCAANDRDGIVDVVDHILEGR